MTERALDLSWTSVTRSLWLLFFQASIFDPMFTVKELVFNPHCIVEKDKKKKKQKVQGPYFFTFGIYFGNLQKCWTLRVTLCNSQGKSY